MTLTVKAVSVANQPYRTQLVAGEHVSYTDVPATMGGGNTAATPHQLFLQALGACTLATIQMYADRRKWPLKGVTVTVKEETIDDPDNAGQKMLRITESIELEGDLTDAQVTALKALPEKCPVYKVLVGRKEVVSELKLAPKAQEPAGQTPVTEAAPAADQTEKQD